MTRDTNNNESREVSLAELITAQIAAQRAGNHSEVYRLELLINQMERFAFSRPIRII